MKPKGLEKSLLWLRSSIAVLGGLSLLGSGLGSFSATATTQSFVIDATPAVSTPVEASSPVEAPKPSVQPQIAPKAPVTKPIVRKEPVKPVYKVSPKSSVTPAARTKLGAPKISVPQKKITVSSPPAVSPSTEIQFESKNRYIDPTNYNINQPASPTVVVTERKTGCQTIAQNGQVSGNCGVSLQKPVSLAKAKPESFNRSRTSVSVAKGRSLRTLTQTHQNRQPIAVKTVYRPTSVQSQVQSSSYSVSRPVTIRSQSVVNLQPIQRQGVSIALEPVAPYNRATTLYSKPTSPIQPRTTDLIFPLPIIGELTSAFGWRQHPIYQTQRFHEGTDIGAAIGTPVLAAYQGQVETADWAGGYGLMVTISHLDGAQESRYAHLSQIFVQPGQLVEQGTVIGRVGSTGSSTGPHLHFEWRHRTDEGWVAVDAGLHLEYALDKLINSFNYARTVEKPES